MTNDAPDSKDLVTQIVGAFERMPVPSAPGVRETIERVEQATSGQANLQPALAAETPVGRFPIARLTVAQRIAAGIGIAAALGVTLLLLTFAPPERLSAMDRVIRNLRQVKSYSYRLSTRNTFVKEGRTEPTSVIRTGTAYWLAPGSLYAEEKIVHIDAPVRTGEEKGEVVAQFTEIFPSGKPGILINHLAKTFVRLPVLNENDIPPYSPVNRLRMVREGEGKIVRDLGAKTINGKPARGYVMALKDAAPGSGSDALEVWVDTDTDLPLKFGYTVKNDKGPEFFRVIDCRWNIEVEAQLFDTTPPPGYADATPPEN